jgi:hypothetical protein
MKTADPKTTSGRAFVRSLNILLKYARLYGYDHSRTIEQLENAERELRAAIPPGDQAGLLLGATGAQLLLDGVPLEGAPAERQFAQLLSAAGLASVQFFPSVTMEELSRFTRAFPTGKAKPSELAQQLKTTLAGAKGIRINEICFVATDSRLRDASMAAQLAAASFGEDHDQFTKWLNDPQKLLELIAAAQGAKSGTGSNGTDTSAAGTPTTGKAAAPSMVGILRSAGLGNGQPFPADASSSGNFSAPASEEEIYGILSALTSIGQVGAGGGGGVAAAGVFHEQMSQLPGRAQDTLKAAISELASRGPSAKPDESTLVQLAEHLAIRFALERYETGEVKVNAVRQMLDRLNQEIGTLRNILGAHEDKMSEAGMLVESHREILDRQFWAGVPETGKRTVLMSEEAWCIPARNVQSYVDELVEQGNLADAASVLQNYASCAVSDEADARRKTAAGLSDMAELYAKVDPKLLGEALRHLGLRLNVEQDGELQGIVSSAFVRLSQEAASKRCFPAMEQALDLVAGVEAQRPGIGRAMRGKMGIEERVPEFVEEALRARQVAAGLTGVLKMMPQTAMEQLASRFNRCSLRDDADNISDLATDLGEEGLQYLRGAVRSGPVAEAVEMVGLLAKLDPRAVEVFLPGRLKDFPPGAQDRILRQISASGGESRCRILLELLDHVDPMVMPLAIDEIGVCGEREALGRLLTIVDGDLPAGAGPYLRVKAVEALGRTPAPEAVLTVKRILQARKVFGWLHPHELRIAAFQALEKLDPAWAMAFLPKSGLGQSDLALAPLAVAANSKFVRQRRHARVRLTKPVVAMCTNLKEACRLDIKTASLSGGVATISRHLTPGTRVQLKMQLGLRNLNATALMRDYRAQDMAFEIVDIGLDERSRLRRMLAEHIVPAADPANADSPENRSAAEDETEAPVISAIG